MLTNKEVAGLFHEMAALMELHEENPFKIRTYENAYLALRKIDTPLLEMDREAWSQIRGIGTAIQEKLEEIRDRGNFDALEEWRKKTPAGIREMLRIKGLGPKKVKAIWTLLQIETPGELLYACYENRLIELKGFGVKLQDDVIRSIEYYNSQQGHFLWSSLEPEVLVLQDALIAANPGIRVEPTGAFRRAMPAMEQIEFIVDAPLRNIPDGLEWQADDRFLWKSVYPVRLHPSTKFGFAIDWIRSTGGSKAFETSFAGHLEPGEAANEEHVFEQRNWPYIPPECRDLDRFEGFEASALVQLVDIRGVVHNHTTYSDGIYSVRRMAEECIRLGYGYLVVSDHSRSAFYANGLSEERVEQQWREIDELNRELHPFRIFKSIESDILSDGSLDYPDAFLKGFDLVIASVHSNLKMDQGKAMGRLLKAIEHPATTILGHPTGRLLLTRPGYPVDHKVLIDACAERQVAIEINANPLRLDLDWSWIPYAMEKNLMISINPDAHNLKGIQDIRHGVMAGRKGGLLKNNCLNSKDVAEFEAWIQLKRSF